MAIPHFKDVPADWKFPFGPYHQAPADYGGDWYLVSPFTGDAPWEMEGKPLASEPPADYVAVCGPRPGIRDPYYQEWTQNLAVWKGLGLPANVTQAQVDSANAVYQAWNMGKMAIYPAQYGYDTRWPETKEYDFDIAASTAVNYPHHVVAMFQIRMAQKGKPPAKFSAWVPPQVYGGEPKKT